MKIINQLRSVLNNSLDSRDRNPVRTVQFGQRCPGKLKSITEVQLFSSGTFMALLQAMKGRYQNQQLGNRKTQRSKSRKGGTC